MSDKESSIVSSLKETSNKLNELAELLSIELSKPAVVVNTAPKTFEERGAEYEREYGLGNFGLKLENKLIVVSLICSFTLMVRKQNPSATVLECVKRLTNYETLAMDDKTGELGKFYENLAITCESFMYGVNEGNTFGLKTGKEVRDKVIELLNNRLPF